MSSPLRRSLLGSGFTRNAVTKISDLESVRVSGVFFSLTIWAFGMAWGLRWVAGRVYGEWLSGWAVVAGWLAFADFFTPICDLGG